jgi:hypothetical protein
MSNGEYEHTVAGEVIKMIHGELPAVRWACGGCGEDACTIFDREETERIVECETCNAANLIHKDRDK